MDKERSLASGVVVLGGFNEVGKIIVLYVEG
jgi:hypothetical protein